MSTPPHNFAEDLQNELPALWRFALKLTASEDDAADLVQRTCLRALERQDTYNASGKMRSWLFRIEHRIWLNELRARQVRQHSSSVNLHDADLESGADIERKIDNIRIDHPEGSVLFQQIVDAVQALPETQRIVMLLVNMEGFTYRETAEILDTPIGTVMSRLARARIAIGENLLASDTIDVAKTTTSDAGAVR